MNDIIEIVPYSLYWTWDCDYRVAEKDKNPIKVRRSHISSVSVVDTDLHYTVEAEETYQTLWDKLTGKTSTEEVIHYVGYTDLKLYKHLMYNGGEFYLDRDLLNEEE